MKTLKKIAQILGISALLFSSAIIPTYAETNTKNQDAVFLEITKSNLEEKSFLANGKVHNFYKTPEEANVSKEAFDKFNQMVEFINTEIDKGTINMGSNIKEITIPNDPKYSSSQHTPANPNLINTDINTVDLSLYNSYSISASKATQIGKALAYGIGAAGLASEFGLPLVVASALVYLYGANEVCNWNNKGYTVYYLKVWLPGLPQAVCIPK